MTAGLTPEPAKADAGSAACRRTDPAPVPSCRLALSTRDLPSEVVAFVGDHIDSVRQLEILLNIRARATAPCTPAALSHELRMPEAWTTQQLKDLEARGLLRRARLNGSAPTFWYEPQDPEMDRRIAQVADCFRRRKTRVVALILSSDVEDPLRSFSDAFRIRKDR